MNGRHFSSDAKVIFILDGQKLIFFLSDWLEYFKFPMGTKNTRKFLSGRIYTVSTLQSPTSESNSGGFWVFVVRNMRNKGTEYVDKTMSYFCYSKFVIVLYKLYQYLLP